jgi:hypothetical protein
VIEAGRAVTWSKPEDLPFGGPVPSLGEKGWQNTPALRFDGSVFLIPTDLKPEQFWPFVTINGGEVTPDLDEHRGPFGARPVPRRPQAEAVAGAGQRDLEVRVAELTEQLRADKDLAAAEADRTARLRKLAATGGAAPAQVAAAEAALVAAEQKVRAREEELAQCQKQLEEARRGSGGAKTPGPPK